MNSNPMAEFIDMELLSRLPSLEMRARFLVEGFLTGLHRCPLKGNSVEFMDYRDYQHGDDLKLIDWKAYARTDRLHIRLREDETNMRVYVVLDRSASMDFKSEWALMSKWDYARSLAAALFLFLHRQRDAAALGFAGEKLEDFIKCGGSRLTHLHSMISMLYRNADASQSNLADSLAELFLKIRRRSIIIVISDFYENVEKLASIMRRFRYERCETLLFQVLDPAELDFDYAASAIFVEKESSSEMQINPALIRKKYRAAVNDHINRLQTEARLSGGNVLLLRTDAPPLKALGLYLATRKGL